nr:MAG TPA: hypothetical protein [Caudoviricetes sp.]
MVWKDISISLKNCLMGQLYFFELKEKTELLLLLILNLQNP